MEIIDRKPPKTRLELDARLQGEGMDAKLYSSEESRDKAKWVLKNLRMGNDRKKIAPNELR